MALRAGPLSMVYESGDLRSIRLGSREVLRRIYVAVRDRNWGTPAPVISAFKAVVKTDSFNISFKADWKVKDINYRSRARLVITPRNPGLLPGRRAGSLLLKPSPGRKVGA